MRLFRSEPEAFVRITGLRKISLPFTLRDCYPFRIIRLLEF